MLLKGIKVLDLSNLLPGPMCSLFLADLGADVVKIESLNGDPMRYFEAIKKNTPSPYFLALNRNKRSISINLKTNEGRKIFMRLSRDADVIIEGFRPGKVDALGIGYKAIKKINPKIIYCSITGYGQKGAYKNKAGHDLNYVALSGVLNVVSKKPFVAGVQIADVSSALIAAFAIVSSLFYREKHGRGNYIDIAVLNGALSVIGMHIAYSSISKNPNSTLSGSKACYNVYETKDGKYVTLGAIENKFWESFCNSLRRKDLLPKQMDSNKKTIKDMQRLFKSKTMNEWVILNKKYDFCCEPVKKIEGVLRDKHLKDNKILIQLDGLKQIAMPVVFSSIERLNYTKAPKLGEHTSKILSSIGYNEESIRNLRIKGVLS